MHSKRAFSLKFSHLSVPLALLLLCILSFGLLIPNLGFYWDDWAKTLVNRLYGPAGYWSYYAEDRPLSAWTHILFLSILGDSPLNWHLLSLVLRWLSAVGLWWVINSLWPQARRLAVFASCLFVVYPVFTLQPVAVTFHQQWLQYGLYFLSLGAMIQAYNKPQRFWPYTALSIFALLLQLTITEYFAVLEFVRLLVLWVLVSRRHEVFLKRLGATLGRWWPYLLLLGGYLVWRLFFIRLSGEDPYRPDYLYTFFVDPKSTLSYLGKLGIIEMFYMAVTSWAGVLDLGVGQILPQSVIPEMVKLSWLVATLTAAVLAVYLTRLDLVEEKELSAESRRSWLLQVLLIGLLAMACGAAPAWISGRQVVSDFHSNRYALPAMFGACLLWAAALEWMIDRPLPKVLALCLMVGLATGFHFRISAEHQDLWASQKDFYWQLYWRVPYLEPKTALLFEQEMFPNQGLFSTSAALNLLYPQPENSDGLAYWIYALKPKYENAIPPRLDKIGFHTQFRTLVFNGAAPDTIIVYYDPGRANCLWLLTPEDEDNPDLAPVTAQMLALSNLERVRSGPVSEQYPPRQLFGDEPEHGFCYFYQKAALAQQKDDWEQVAVLADQVRRGGYHPADYRFKTPQEWLTFIEGYARSGRWEEAAGLAGSAAEINSAKYAPRVCSFWRRLMSVTPSSPQREEASAALLTRLGCSAISN